MSCDGVCIKTSNDVSVCSSVGLEGLASDHVADGWAQPGGTVVDRLLVENFSSPRGGVE